MSYISGTRGQVRAARVALNKAAGQRGVALGGPDFVPAAVDDEGNAPGWTLPCSELIEEGSAAAIEVADDINQAHLDGKDGRPLPTALKTEAQLPVALRDKIRASRSQSNAPDQDPRSPAQDHPSGR